MVRLIKYLPMIFLAVGAEAQVANLALVNSTSDEQNPVMSPDGKQLYFTLASNAQNSGGTGDHGDIWVSMLLESGWSAPVRTGDAMNNNLHNVVAGFSADGSRMYLIGHYQPEGKPVTSQGLSVCRKTAAGWSAPTNIAIPYFRNKSPYQSGYVSPDEKVFVYSAESYSTYGADDIYVSLAGGGKWSEPVNLGSAINTANQEVSPSLSRDGRRLFFASNGHDGLGSFDIFYADRLDDSWTKWSAPVNMGKDFNTEGRELFYREFGDGAFFTSTMNSDGVGNIRYLPAFADTSAQSIPAVAVQEIAPAVIDTPQQSESSPGQTPAKNIAGKVTNSNTNGPIPGASIVFHSVDQQVETAASDDGQYSAALPAGSEYNVRVEAKGFIGKFEKLTLQPQGIEMNFILQPVEVGTTINLKSVLFVQSKPLLLEESYDELDMVVDFMKGNQTVEIELGGHTDNRGRHDQNMKLSRERVNTVKEYLVKQGIEEKRITGRGYGGTRPIADNEGEDTRAMNRRVEFTIVKE